MAITIFDKDISNLTDVELTKRLKAQSSKANSRLYNLEKTDLARSSEAYGIVERKNWDKLKYAYKTDYRSRARFRTDVRNRDRKDLVLELQEVEKFLTYKTSTASGVKKARWDQYQGYMEFWRKKLDKPDYYISFEDYSEYWKDEKMAAIKNTLSSGGQAEIFSLAYQKGFSQAELREVLEKTNVIQEDDKKVKIEASNLNEVKAYIELVAYLKENPEEKDKVDDIYKQFLDKIEKKGADDWASSEQEPW